MTSDFFFLLVIIGWLLMGFLIIKMIRLHIRAWFWRLLFVSIIAALFLGVGFVSGGGDPVCALPAPVILAAWYTERSHLFDNAIRPFLFCWVLIFLLMLVLKAIKLIWSDNKQYATKNVKS
ncbi:MAG: hypothetical protein ABI480_01670 [Chitinophagaceae bacterium]